MEERIEIAVAGRIPLLPQGLAGFEVNDDVENLVLGGISLFELLRASAEGLADVEAGRCESAEQAMQEIRNEFRFEE